MGHQEMRMFHIVYLHTVTDNSMMDQHKMANYSVIRYQPWQPQRHQQGEL